MLDRAPVHLLLSLQWLLPDHHRVLACFHRCVLVRTAAAATDDDSSSGATGAATSSDQTRLRRHAARMARRRIQIHAAADADATFAWWMHFFVRACVFSLSGACSTVLCQPTGQHNADLCGACDDNSCSTAGAQAIHPPRLHAAACMLPGSTLDLAASRRSSHCSSLRDALCCVVCFQAARPVSLRAAASAAKWSKRRRCAAILDAAPVLTSSSHTR